MHTKKMHALMLHADDNSDGALTLEEFRHVIHDDAVRTWLCAMELDIRDIDALFHLLDNGDGRLSAKELVQGAARLKGGARSLDMNLLLKHQRLQTFQLLGELKHMLRYALESREHRSVEAVERTLHEA